MADTTLESLKRVLDSEIQTTVLFQLPVDFYSKVSIYSQKLRRSAGSGTSEVANRLIAKQVKMIDSMTRQLLALRVKKATQQHGLLQLLPKERYVCSAQQSFQRRFEAFVEAVSAGEPSFIQFANKSDAERNISVRFTKHTGEIVGLDMRHYGPFEEDDIVSLPAANADILIASGNAMEIYTRDEA